MGELTLFPQPKRPAGRPPKIKVATDFAEAVRHAEHLRQEDRALVELGRRLAVQIDRADDDKTLANLTVQFLGVLDRLGLSPQARSRLGLEKPAEEVNPFDEARRLLESRWGVPADQSGVPG